jgi:1-acyl-sn-glycerol-3-phosphate acyltransferase
MIRPKTTWNYSQLDDSQLGWFHIVAQWICIRILHAYCHSVYSLKVTGKENQPKEWQSYVVAANHLTSLDPPMVSVALDFQPVSYMAKRELFKRPIVRLYNWAMGSFAVNRDKLDLSTVKSALKVLKHGKWALGIFPEGTRNKDGTINDAKRGVAYFARVGNVPVLPLGVYCSGRRMSAHIGKMIPPEKDLDALTEKIQQSIAELLEKAKADVS